MCCVMIIQQFEVHYQSASNEHLSVQSLPQIFCAIVLTAWLTTNPFYLILTFEIRLQLNIDTMLIGFESKIKNLAILRTNEFHM